MYSYSRVSARLGLSRSRLGIGRQKGRTDLCAVCHTWDVAVSGPLSHNLSQAQGMLRDLLPQYWEGFEEGFPDCRAAGFRAIESVEYFEHLADWIRCHGDRNQERRQQLPDDVSQELEQAEATILSWLDDEDAGALRTIKEHSLHWRLRDYLHECLSRELEQPSSGWLYLWMDFEDSPPHPQHHEKVYFP